MNISSSNQLVPYQQRPQQLATYWQREPVADPANRFPATQRYVLNPASYSSGYDVHTPNQNPIYTSNRRIKLQEMNHVGSLIDIYA